MDERIDILTKNGKPTGKTAMKSEAHRNGLFHATVHIWFYTKNGDILFQKRAKTKDTHPGLWDVSVAGHIGAKEDILESALRETQEEIGLKIQKENLLKIGVFKSVQKHSEILVDCEFHHTFLSELKIPFDNLIKQDSEVDALKLFSINILAAKLKNKELFKGFVPHQTDYYTTVFSHIKKLL